MPEEDFEIRGAHEDAMEERAHHEPLSQKIALFSAVLATLGAIVSFLGGHTQNDALYYKNEAVLMKARASDSWSYYQAEDIKRHLAETLSADGQSAKVRAGMDAKKYASRARTLRATAEEYDRKSQEADAESQHALQPHTKLAIAMTFIQVAIALASITALTQRRWLLWGAAGSALVAIVLSVIAWF
ncbi:DUF4337 domain-containing protein [Novosphingobium sp. Leaf2]|uniref:DUF4337 domain-containing protein n=1 Tax=Novosphingobium sp. Leaf2 TaxID=1735670 RepID=UPI0006F91433|nr:DUF4337 domain-containing protein [Novosphingobium sp. Leaf2]KQM21370.1 hypothetical protein ASE49_14925 [Novosphingobium sp. Leaf2]